MNPENRETACENTPGDSVDMLVIARRTGEREIPDPSSLTKAIQPLVNRVPLSSPLRAGVAYPAG
jgi:hypothetical protein